MVYSHLLRESFGLRARFPHSQEVAYSARPFITNLVEMDEHLFHLDHLVDRIACERR